MYYMSQNILGHNNLVERYLGGGGDQIYIFFFMKKIQKKICGLFKHESMDNQGLKLWDR